MDGLRGTAPHCGPLKRRAWRRVPAADPPSHVCESGIDKATLFLHVAPVGDRSQHECPNNESIHNDELDDYLDPEGPFPRPDEVNGQPGSGRKSRRVVCIGDQNRRSDHAHFNSLREHRRVCHEVHRGGSSH